MNGTPSIFVYKSRANMAWSPKYTLTTILSYYFIYDYTFIIIGNYIWLQIQPCQILHYIIKKWWVNYWLKIVNFESCYVCTPC
jgi:hypothetical protein